MNTAFLPNLQALHGLRNLGGAANSMQLTPGCALSFCPQVAGILRVPHGRVWVTLGDGVDHFVSPENWLGVQARQRVVAEAWPAIVGACTRLVWEPAASSKVRALIRQ